MAIGATAVGEIRATGNATNGMFFDAEISGAGTDYTQRDTPILTLTDIACSQNSTTITSVTGGFTSDMIGNALYQSSASNNNIAGYRFITDVTDTNTATIDSTIATAGNGTLGAIKVGGAVDVLTDAICELLVAGNTVWIKGSSSYSPSAISVASTAATAALNVTLKGYYATRNDKPSFANQPTLAMGSNSVSIQQHWNIDFIKLTGTGTEVLKGSSSGNWSFSNGKITNSSGTANRAAIILTGANALNSEFISTNGYAVQASGNALGDIKSCYMHDSVYGIYCASSGGFNLDKCVIDSCTTAGYLVNRNGVVVDDTIFYNCPVGFDVAATYRHRVSGSIFHTCSTSGISASSALQTFWCTTSLYYNNGANGTNVTLDSSCILDVDPLFTDPANGDFTLRPGSPALNMGFDYAKIGLTGSYRWNIGIDQGDHITPSKAWVC
jgi:hypothetical protein